MALLVSHRQLALELPEPAEGSVERPAFTHGGRREGAGRKPKAGRRNVAHRARPDHAARHPIHVTLRGRREVAFFRREVVFRAVRQAFAAANARADEGSFRIVHYSVQRDHLHLIVEAADAQALRSGMQGLTTRLARAVNRVARRRGPVWGERYHRHDLERPSEVRHALVYVLQNGAKHGVVRGRDPRDPLTNLDPMSSAAYFGGWTARAGPRLAEMGTRLPPREDPECPVREPGTWLARKGWASRSGRIDPAELPAPPRPRR